MSEENQQAQASTESAANTTQTPEANITSRAELHAEIEKDWKARSASKKQAAQAQMSSASVPSEKVIDNPNVGLESVSSVANSSSSSMWDEMAEEFKPKPTQEEQEEAALEPEVKKSSGYQKLKAEKAQLADKVAQFEEQMRKLSMQPAVQAPAQPAGPSPDVLALQQQVQMLTQTLTQLAQPKPQAMDPNDPLNLVYQGLAPRFQQEALSPIEQRLAAMEARDQEREAYLQSLQEREIQSQRAAEKAQLAASYKSQAQAAMDSSFYSSSAMEDVKAKSTMEQAVILLALANKISPEQAAMQLKQANVHWAQGVERKKNGPAIQKAQASGSVPRPAPEATTRALGGEETPPIKDLQAAGYKTIYAWQMAGSPSIRNR